MGREGTSKLQTDDNNHDHGWRTLCNYLQLICWEKTLLSLLICQGWSLLKRLHWSSPAHPPKHSCFKITYATHPSAYPCDMQSRNWRNMVRCKHVAFDSTHQLVKAIRTNLCVQFIEAPSFLFGQRRPVNEIVESCWPAISHCRSVHIIFSKFHSQVWQFGLRKRRLSYMQGIKTGLHVRRKHKHKRAFLFLALVLALSRWHVAYACACACVVRVREKGCKHVFTCPTCSLWWADPAKRTGQPQHLWWGLCGREAAGQLSCLLSTI